MYIFFVSILTYFDIDENKEKVLHFKWSTTYLVVLVVWEKKLFMVE